MKHTIKEITHQYLLENHGNELQCIKADERRIVEGIIEINDIMVYNYYRNKIDCADKDCLASITFYDKDDREITRIFLSSSERMLVINSYNILVGTSIRVSNEELIFYSRLLSHKRLDYEIELEIH